MNWIILVIATILIDSIIIFTDNYISDYYFKGRGAVSQKVFLTFIQIITGIIILLIFGINFSNTNFSTIITFISSGLIISFANIFYYKALELDNSTNFGIFVQVAPILYLLLGCIFFKETLTWSQILASIIILLAPILIVFTTRKRSRKIRIQAIIYTFICVLFNACANMVFVKSNNSDLGFATELALVFLGSGIGNIIILLLKPRWRHRFFTILKTSHKKVLLPLSASAILDIVKDFTYRGALVLAPTVALASATSDSAEPIVIFFMGLLLTLIWPKFGRENLNRKSIITHLIATILVVTGIILLQL